MKLCFFILKVKDWQAIDSFHLDIIHNSNPTECFTSAMEYIYIFRSGERASILFSRITCSVSTMAGLCRGVDRDRKRSLKSRKPKASKRDNKAPFHAVHFTGRPLAGSRSSAFFYTDTISPPFRSMRARSPVKLARPTNTVDFIATHPVETRANAPPSSTYFKIRSQQFNRLNNCLFDFLQVILLWCKLIHSFKNFQQSKLN